MPIFPLLSTFPKKSVVCSSYECFKNPEISSRGLFQCECKLRKAATNVEMAVIPIKIIVRLSVLRLSMHKQSLPSKCYGNKHF